MKEYQFQYTKMWGTLSIVLSAIAVFILTAVFGIYYNLNLLLTIFISFGLAILLFQIFKRKVVYPCTAKLGNTSVIFEFKSGTKAINFSNLTSYKSYYGKNGPILYLKSNSENFKVFANNNFCKTDSFKKFCDDTIAQLDKYRDTHNLALINEDSIFTKKGMLYFLIIATLIYLLAFFVETNTLRIAIGIGGGFYFFIMWAKYLIENDKAKK